MDMEEKRNQLVWNTHWEDMRVIASQLHHQATQADVYLHTLMTSVDYLANTTTTTAAAADENWRSSSSSDTLGSGTNKTAFPAHRVILAAASPFLCKVLHDHYLDHRDTCSTIMLPQVSSATLTHILDFVYCGHATIPWAEREKVLEAAQLLQIMSLIACLQPSTVKVKDGRKAASCLLSSGAMASEIKPEMRRGRKRKNQEGSSANETFSNLQSKVKKKVSTDTDHESCEENPLGRSRRKIKSRYSSDDYELSVPELRPVKSKPLLSAPTSKQISLTSVIVSPLKDKDLSNFTLPCHVRNEPLPLQSDKLCSFVSPPSSLPSMASQSVSSLPLCYTNNPSVLDIKDPENNNPYLSPSESSKGGKSVVSIHVDNVKTSVNNEEGDWCLTPSLDSVCIEVYEKSECSKPLVAISPISTSQVDSSPVVPHLFTSETNVTYLENADPPKQLVKQLLKSLEPPSEETELSLPCREIATLPVLPEPSDPSLLSPMKDLESTSPAVATTTYLQDLTVQNLPPSLSRSLEPTSDQSLEPSQSSLMPTKSLGSSSSLSDNKMKSEDQYEEDGLFTFQVLIKECEGFSESTVRSQCVTGDGIGEMEGSEAEKQPGDGDGVDINQWLSEEINNYLQPQANSESTSQLETVVGSPNEPMESSCQNDNNTATNSATTTTIDKNKMSFECEQCGKKFDEMRRCQSHMHLVHREARHMCRYCGRMFKRRCDLLQHERRHKSPALPCKMCGKVFKLPKDLAAHMATHSRERRYKCNICNKELTTVRNLKNHITSFHHKQRTFVCQICNKSFSKSSSLQVHMRSVHTGERPFSCNICSKNFHDLALLKIHQAIHTGEQKYSCKVCGRGFTQYSNMISHQRVHTNKRPYTCTVCKETFKTKDALMKHKWTHSGLKPLQCQQCSKAFRVRESYERHMLKCHNELGHLPAIYFEVPEQQVTHEGPLAASSCSIVEASSEQDAPTLHISSDVGEKILSHDSINKDLMEDISPVVQLMGGMTEEAGQVQITYPLLTSNPEFDDSHDIPISSHTPQVYPVTGPVQSIDVGALLSDEVNITGSTELVSSEDRMRSELTASIGDSVNSECKNVVILDKFTQDNNSAIHSQISSSSTSNIIWMPDDSGVMENDGNLNGKTNIFIVSDETFPAADTSMPVLTSGLVSPVVQTVILNTPDADV
ncbi:hypothetical protein Pmani_007382 [Petrolisthes manimaculis]|uniref:Uncharacterized protein n=1 Tax=Petrolisthes manimaculis TaxID=1843537 RepID=A0AAE1UK73_9EUCA|nr:hypothetical protein Pmani_007382 [Petrolisthes manimaculis]